MSKRICSNCHYAIQDIPEMFCLFRKLHTQDGLFENCHCFFQKSVFDRITASPVVLAERLVYRYDGNGTWRSFLLYGYEFLTKEEAIAATVAKLKEVEDGQ